MLTINTELLARLTDLCREHGWTGVGPEHDIVRWLGNRLRAIDECEDVSLEDDGHGSVFLSLLNSEAMDDLKTENDYLETRLTDLRRECLEQLTDARQALDEIESKLND